MSDQSGFTGRTSEPGGHYHDGSWYTNKECRHVTRYLSIGPAYGRDYATEDEAVTAWLGGADFRMYDVSVRGTYISVRELPDGWVANLRYSGLTEVVPVNASGRVVEPEE